MANIFRAGWNNQSLTTRGITIRDCDVIHMERPLRRWLGADWALFTSVIPQGAGQCEHSDYLFENIRCEDPIALLGVNWPGATLKNFRFSNIQIPDEAGQSLVRADADGITFDDIRVAGRPATQATDIRLTVEGEAKNILFSPPAK